MLLESILAAEWMSEWHVSRLHSALSVRERDPAKFGSAAVVVSIIFESELRFGLYVA